MYTLLIVDDEYYIREGLKQKIDWEGCGVQVIGTAKNAVEAMELAEEHAPDIILTDIRMNGGDGLSMIEELKRRGFGCKFIVMSGYTLFEYAHKALEEGVCFYLVKPIKKDELIETVKKVTALLDETKTDSVGRALAENDAFYRALLSGSCGPRPELAGWVVCAALFDRPALAHLETKRAALSAVGSVSSAAQCFFPASSELLVLLPDGADAGKLSARLSGALEGAFWMGVSGPLTGAESFAAAKAQAEQALSYRIYFNHLSLFHFGDIPEARLPRADFLGRIDHIAEFVETHRNREVKELIDSAARQFVLEKTVPRDVVWWFSGVISAVEKLCSRADVTETPDFEAFNRSVSRMATLTEMRDSVFTLCAEGIERLQKASGNQMAASVERIVEYIDNHCMEELSLTNLAKSFYVDVTYLSKLIKGATGKSFVKYITEKRLDKAKELLRESDVPVSEIASRVGYPEANYFSQLFKRIEGVSPTDYRINSNRDHTD